MSFQKKIHSGNIAISLALGALFLGGSFLWLTPGLCLASDLAVDEASPDRLRTTPAINTELNTGLGPLLLRGQSPFQLLRLSLIPTNTGNIQKGHVQLNTTATWTNRWSWSADKYLIDGEILHMAFFATYGVTDWMQVRLEIPFAMRGGGFMDGFIEEFHNAFGFPQSGRDEFPRDRFRITLWRKDGTIFELNNSDPWIGIEDLVLSATFRITHGTRWIPHTSLTLHLKLPTGDKDDLYGSGSLDGGLSLCFSKRIWKLYGYLEVQYTRYGGDELAGIPMKNDQVALLTAIEYPWTDRFSIILQEIINTGAAEDFYQFSDSTHELTLGLKAEFLTNTFFEFGLIENLLNFDNSPDLGLHFGLSKRF